MLPQRRGPLTAENVKLRTMKACLGVLHVPVHRGAGPAPLRCHCPFVPWLMYQGGLGARVLYAHRRVAFRAPGARLMLAAPPLVRVLPRTAPAPPRLRGPVAVGSTIRRMDLGGPAARPVPFIMGSARRAPYTRHPALRIGLTVMHAAMPRTSPLPPLTVLVGSGGRSWTSSTRLPGRLRICPARMGSMLPRHCFRRL